MTLPRLVPGLALLAAALVLAAAPLAATAQESRMPATITVTGEGQVTAVPDMATVSLGVTTRGESAAEALAANSAEMEKVLAALKEAGIDPRDIQTASVSLGPVWDSGSYSTPKITGYEAGNQVSVRVRDLPALGQVLDDLVAVGANQLNGLSFGLAEPRPVLDAARRDAVSDARRKAELLAEAAGMGLGEIVAVTEGGGPQGGPVPMFARDAARAVPVAEGELTMSASVSITWVLVGR